MTVFHFQSSCSLPWRECKLSCLFPDLQPRWPLYWLEGVRTDALSFHETSIVFQLEDWEGIEELQNKEVWGTWAAVLVNTNDLQLMSYNCHLLFWTDLLRAWTVFLRKGLHGLVLVLSGSQLMLMSYFSGVHVSSFLRPLFVFWAMCCLENC